RKMELNFFEKLKLLLPKNKTEFLHSIKVAAEAEYHEQMELYEQEMKEVKREKDYRLQLAALATTGGKTAMEDWVS
ncbi:hypothetical protein, partial [Pseudomonas sp. 2995-3]|uniref:hypothetical protein n=1 Tax=Pseudomonas sp. 2995-3 TaxID=1712680 RepID=UPI000C5541E2